MTKKGADKLSMPEAEYPDTSHFDITAAQAKNVTVGDSVKVELTGKVIEVRVPTDPNPFDSKPGIVVQVDKRSVNIMDQIETLAAEDDED